MTTPAINSSKVSHITGSVVYITNGVETLVEHRDVICRRQSEVRPASVTNRMGPGGWRQPSGWSHSVSDYSAQPLGANIVVRDRRNPKSGDGVYWYDGTGWDQQNRGLQAFDTALTNRAVIQALNRLKNQKVNLGVAFAEREKTAQLFYEGASKIAKTVRAFRNGNPKKIWDLIVAGEGRRGAKIPQSWLEVQYGWNPTLNDIAGAYSSLRDREGTGKSYFVTVHGKAKAQFSGTWQKSAGFTGSIGINVSFQELHEARVRLDYYLRNPVLASLSSLGVTNPGLIVYELVPYSFVLDWIFPIGDAISAFDAALGYDFLSGTSTQYRRCVQKGVSWWGSGRLDINRVAQPYGDPSSYFDRRMDMKRSVYTSSPLPRFPGFKNPLSSGHIANGLSLLVSAFGATPSGYRAR